MQFDDALRYLLSLGHETAAIKLGLANTEALLDALGRPQDAFASVQIAGTNGKGSTAAMLDRMMRAAGVRTGLYTSPHLVSITERIRIAGNKIAREDFARVVSRTRAAALDVERATGALPTFFEQVTAAALVAFREARIKLAILETGLGGRLDATTVAGASVVAITPVALDHQEYLGETLAEIAAEKAAIIRRGIHAAVVAPRQSPEAEAVIRRRCADCGVAPRFATRDIRVEGATPDGRLRASFTTRRDTYENVTLALRGRHQTDNAAVAIELAEVLCEQGFPVSRAAIIEGLERAEHDGRLEMLADVAPPLLLDGAHNPAGARALRDYLGEFVHAPVSMIFGAMRDKELDEIGATLFPFARRLILTQPANPRAASPVDLMNAIPPATDSSTITLAPSVREALRVARAQTPSGGLICVTGSLYLVGEVKSILEMEGVERSQG
ncbi:MAG TPA: Mur ligase family protein [Pyrinomonadaceae bacterium]|jgi:dihydrofolate synthase/folylpolyglutamate synthase